MDVTRKLSSPNREASREALRAFVAGHRLAHDRQQQELASGRRDDARFVLEIMNEALKSGKLLDDPAGVRERGVIVVRETWARLREAWPR